MANVKLQGVYYLESQNPTMNLIAIRPEVTSGYAAWEDTSNGRIIKIEKVLFDGKEIKENEELHQINALPESIEIFGADGQRYQLIKLTKRIFTEKLKNIVACGENLVFTSDQDVQDFYLKSSFN